MTQTRLTESLGITWPIIQAPMVGGFSSPQMVATVSNLGGLGTLALGNSTPEQIIDSCKQVVKLTNKPFAANLFVIRQSTSPHTEVKARAIESLRSIYGELGIDPSIHYHRPFKEPIDLASQVEAVLDSKVPIVSFTFGLPAQSIIDELKRHGVFLMGTATSVAEARRVENAGFDAVILQGVSAGGHRASFLNDGVNGPDTEALLRQTLSSVTVPKVVTGGIADGKEISEFLQTGADACQLGSAYLYTYEACLEPHIMEVLMQPSYTTCLSKGFTGKYARVVTNRYTVMMENAYTAPFPYQSELTADIKQKAVILKDHGLLPVYIGHSTKRHQMQSVKSLMESLIAELGYSH